VTYSSDYVEKLWGVIKKIWDRGLLYQDYRVTPHCPRCGTSLSSHELAQGYKDVKDISVYAKFRVVGKENEYLVAWTTTPWTLPANVALAVGAGIKYVKVHLGEEYLWIAKDRADIVMAHSTNSSYEIVDERDGSELVGMEYEPLYPFVRDALVAAGCGDHAYNGLANAWKVHAADFVTTTDGTGIVHTAVMYGADDFDLGTKVGLPKHHLVKLDGTFATGTDFLVGRLVTDEDVAVDIIKDLAHRGLLFHKEKFEHSYPHCWRCKSKVIYYAKDSWYIRMSSLRDKLLEENEKINWEPSHLKDGRFGEWLREIKDWAFSRERYWGTPLPIWVCAQCGEKQCIGSFAELGVGADFDPHRPFCDEVVLACGTCGGSSRRVKDVCDVWFDSGAMPFASGEYPTHYPADFISEAIDQTRGWFYTLLAVSTALGLERPFKNVICLGHVLDAKGKKMSKSLGNIVKPMEMIDAYGADSVRWYMYTVNQPGESKRFDEKALVEMQRAVFGILGNVMAFYETYAGETQHRVLGFPTPGVGSEHVLDRWILARLHETVREVTDGLEAYRVTEPARLIGSFIDDFSTWWLRRSRDRFKETSSLSLTERGRHEEVDDKSAALATMHECLLTIAKLMAPFTPFFAEDVYLRLGGGKESVHLEQWPEVDVALIDEPVLKAMAQTRSIVSKLLEARANAGKNVRQPLASATITLPDGHLGDEYLELIKDEVNVKEIIVQKGEYAVALDVTLTPALVREGTVREIVRRLNAMRKNAGLTIDDRVEVFVASSEPEVAIALEEHGHALVAGVLGASLRTTGDAPENAETFRANEFEMTIGFSRI
jgi:isoleucyl-tRNA synthetase